MDSVKELELKPLSSLAKVFPRKIYGKKSTSAIAFHGQELSFQVAYRLVDPKPYLYLNEYQIRVIGDFSSVTVARVGYVPCLMPVFFNTKDKNLIKRRESIPSVSSFREKIEKSHG